MLLRRQLAKLGSPAQFLQLITAVKSRFGRGQLDEANRAVNMVIRYVSNFDW